MKDNLINILYEVISIILSAALASLVWIAGADLVASILFTIICGIPPISGIVEIIIDWKHNLIKSKFKKKKLK